MCGISGYISFTKDKSFDIKRSIESISHRGPDAIKFNEFKHGDATIGLAHARLSIIDLTSAGIQPMQSGSGKVIISFNGEIYNYKDLKNRLELSGSKFRSNSDTEVILEGYERFGIDFVHSLKGMFAFSLYDSEAGEVYLVRDRIGVKPLYVLQSQDLICFSSEIRGIVDGSKQSFQVNKSSLINYLMRGYVGEDASILDGVSKIRPGEILKINIGSRRQQNIAYWKVADFYDQALQVKQVFSQSVLVRQLEDAISSRLVADVDIGIFLSGGYDSATVAAISARRLGRKLPAFTIGFEEKSFDESQDAQEIARILGLDHHVKICSAKESMSIIEELPSIYDEPFGDSSAIPTVLLSRFTRGYVKAAISADGGDELFGGYRKYINALKLVRISRNIGPLRRILGDYLADFLDNRIVGALFSAEINREVLSKALEIISINPVPARASFAIENSLATEKKLRYYLNTEFNAASAQFALKSLDVEKDDPRHMFYIDLVGYLPSDILVKVDRASMSCGLEAREPLLDHSLIEYASSIPFEYLINESGGKSIIKDVCHQYLPIDLMNKKKRGFGVPVRDWMRADLKHMFDDVFFYDVASLNEFDIPRLQGAVKNYYKGDNSNFNFLWYVFCYVKWKTKYMH